MSEESVYDLGQRFLAAAWDAARLSFSQGPEAVTGLLDLVAVTQAQLSGLRLEVLEESRFIDSGAQVLDAVRESTRENPARVKAQARLAQRLTERFTLVSEALCAGVVSLAQAEAIVDGLGSLPGVVAGPDLERCQRLVLDEVGVLGPRELRIFATHLLEVLDPQAADQAEAERVRRQEQQANRTRFLRLRPDHHGSISLTGRVPVADGALLQAQLDALLPTLASYGGGDEVPSREARYADALMLLAKYASASGGLPAHGGDRPQVIVTIGYQTLLDGIGTAQLPITGEQISAREARRLACDAHIIPAVLGHKSGPLDVGRAERLVGKRLRKALLLRDGGCAFPGCEAKPAACDAHHIIPWCVGGGTDKSNTVLLCPYHHKVVEPDEKLSEHSQWIVEVDAETGLPYFTPPRHVDPKRRRRCHRRLTVRLLRPKDPAPPPPDEPVQTYTDAWGQEQDTPPRPGSCVA